MDQISKNKWLEFARRFDEEYDYNYHLSIHRDVCTTYVTVICKTHYKLVIKGHVCTCVNTYDRIDKFIDHVMDSMLTITCEDVGSNA